MVAAWSGTVVVLLNMLHYGYGMRPRIFDKQPVGVHTATNHTRQVNSFLVGLKSERVYFGRTDGIGREANAEAR